MAANKYPNSSKAMMLTMMVSMIFSYSLSQKRTYSPLTMKNATTIPT